MTVFCWAALAAVLAHLAAVVVVALTRTPCAEEALTRGQVWWAAAYPWLELVAGVTGRAKELPGGGWKLADDVERSVRARVGREMLEHRDRVVLAVQAAVTSAGRAAAAQVADILAQAPGVRERGPGGTG